MLDIVGEKIQQRAEETKKVHCTWYCNCSKWGICVFVEPPGMFPDRPPMCGKECPFSPVFFKEYGAESMYDF